NLRDYKVEEVVEGGAESAPGRAEPPPQPQQAAAPGSAVPSAPPAVDLAEPAGAGPARADPENGATAAATAAATAVARGPPGSAPSVPERRTLGSSALPVRVRSLLPGEDSRWDAFVGWHPEGTFFHLSGWGRVVRETFGHEQHYLVAEEGRRWVGVLPLFLVRMFQVRRPYLGRNLVSVPYAVYGGVLADSPAAQEALLARAGELARERDAGFVAMRP